MHYDAIILDTDIGYDPDDLFALLFLKELAGNKLKLLVTSNEIKGKRAQFAKMILEEIGLLDVSVVQGSDIGLDKFTVDSLMPKNGYVISVDYCEQIKKVIDAHQSVVYIGIGGFSNLAHFIEQYPEYKNKMDVVVMGGAVNYERKPGWVEFNIKIDPESARSVISSGISAKYIMAQTTHNPIYEVTAEHAFYKKLAISNKSGHQLLYQHCKLWFEERGHGTSMHDPLTIATAFGYDFAKFNKSKVVLNAKNQIVMSDSGSDIEWSDPVSHAKECMDLIEKTLFS